MALARNLFAASVLAGVVGCSFVLDTDAPQCATDGDCAKYNVGALYRCVDNGCVAQARTDAGPSSSIQCSTNQECATTGDVGVCLLGACTALRSSDCAEVVGDVNNDRTLVLGALAPLTGRHEDSGKALLDAMKLASSELTAKKDALARPVAFVVCDDQTNAKRAAEHLVNDLHVPGLLTSGITGVAETALAVAGDKAAVLTSTSSAEITPSGSVWRLVPSVTTEATAIAQLKVAAEKAAGMPTTTKWSVLKRNDALGTQLATAVMGTLASAMVVVTPVSYGNPDTGETEPFANAIASAKTANVVVLLGESEVDTLITELEKTSMTRAYIVSGGGISPRLLALPPAVRARIIGVLPLQNRDGAPYTTFSLAYGRLFPQDVGVRTHGVAQTYDAFYAMSYVGSALPANTSATGAAFKAGLGKLSSGTTKLVVGAAAIEATATALAAGPVNLDGVSGPIDFDANGGVESSFQVVCIDAGGSWAFAGAAVVSGALNAKIANCGAFNDPPAH